MTLVYQIIYSSFNLVASLTSCYFDHMTMAVFYWVGAIWAGKVSIMPAKGDYFTDKQNQ